MEKKQFQFIQELLNYTPFNEQERVDKQVILDYATHFSDILDRKNQIVHMSASSWILNQDRSKVLLAYHKIYQSWTWTGGHADGEDDLLAVAIKEAKEETGLSNIWVISPTIFSIENLCVNGHWKNNAYVTSHLHLNVTYLLEANDQEPLIINEQENSGLKWFPIEEVMNASNEEWMNEVVFQKLIQKYKEITKKEKRK